MSSNNQTASPENCFRGKQKSENCFRETQCVNKWDCPGQIWTVSRSGRLANLDQFFRGIHCAVMMTAHLDFARINSVHLFSAFLSNNIMRHFHDLAGRRTSGKKRDGPAKTRTVRLAGLCNVCEPTAVWPSLHSFPHTIHQFSCK